MGEITSMRTAVCVAAMTVALISAAQATATRTYVNAETGSDSNTASNCVATTPCKTFAVAYTVTQSGGEIVAMAPGGYGPITITTPLTIIGTDGATVTAAGGTTAITVSAAAAAMVYIRNLQITGAGAANSIGIQVTGGTLVLRDSALKLLTTGLLVGNNSATAHADVINIDFIGNGTAITNNGAGVDTTVGSPPFTGTQTLVRLSGGNFVGNTTTFKMQNAAADTNTNCKNTFWFINASIFNVTATTTFFTVSPSNPPFNCNTGQSYSFGFAPN